MRVKYVGPLAGVEIAATGQEVERGGVVEVPDELGRSLCEQVDNWEPVAAVKVDSKSKKDEEG